MAYKKFVIMNFTLGLLNMWKANDDMIQLSMKYKT